MCERLVGLGDVKVIGVEGGGPAGLVRVHIETRGQRTVCQQCATPAWVKDRGRVELVDLPCFGRPSRLVWHKVRWRCPNPACLLLSWTRRHRRSRRRGSC